MSTLLALFLNNPYLLAAAGALIGAGALFAKGYSQGKAAVKNQDNKAQAEIASEVQQAEAANQQTELQRSEANEKVDSNSDSINQLIGLWNELNNKKTPGDPTKPNP